MHINENMVHESSNEIFGGSGFGIGYIGLPDLVSQLEGQHCKAFEEIERVERVCTRSRGSHFAFKSCSVFGGGFGLEYLK